MPELALKHYQQQTLQALSLYCAHCQQYGNADTAFYETTRALLGAGLPYRDVAALPGLPYICLRLPTGGGKTLLAAHAAGVAARELVHSERPLILWLVPSNAILEQTLTALRAPQHPY